MVRWRMDKLLARYEEATGEKLATMELCNGAGLSTSTAYLVTRNQPKRIGLESINAILTFFSQHIGEVNAADLIEFELE